jgi:hypothetical protein
MFGIILLLLLSVVVTVIGVKLIPPPAKKKAEASTAEGFLDRALDGYIRAYQFKRPEDGEPFVTVPCLMDLMNKIRYHNVKDFAEKAHRHVVWTPCGDMDGDGTKVYRLNISFDTVKSKDLERFTRYGQPIEEFWKLIEVTASIYKIMSIRDGEMYVL